MVEKAVNFKCEACKKNFDDEKKTPMILSCEHLMCYECIQNRYLNAKKVQCAKDGCKEITKDHPTKIKPDEDLLQSMKQQFLENDLEILKKLENDASLQIQKIAKVKLQMQNKLIQDLENHFLVSISDIQKDLINTLVFTKKSINTKMEQQSKSNPQNQKNDLAREDYIKMIKNGQSVLQKAQQAYNKMGNLDNNIFQQNIKYKTMIKENQRQIKLSQEYIKEQTSQIQILSQQLLNSQNRQIQERDQIMQQWLDYQEEQEQQSSSYQQQIQKLNQKLDSQKKNLQTTQSVQQQKIPQISIQIKDQNVQTKNKNLQIIILTPNYKSLPLQVKQDTTIQQLKAGIQEHTKLFSWSLNVIKNNMILEDDKTLSYYQVVNGEQLFIN